MCLVLTYLLAESGLSIVSSLHTPLAQVRVVELIAVLVA